MPVQRVVPLQTGYMECHPGKTTTINQTKLFFGSGEGIPPHSPPYFIRHCSRRHQDLSTLRDRNFRKNLRFLNFFLSGYEITHRALCGRGVPFALHFTFLGFLPRALGGWAPGLLVLLCLYLRLGGRLESFAGPHFPCIFTLNSHRPS